MNCDHHDHDHGHGDCVLSIDMIDQLMQGYVRLTLKSYSSGHSTTKRTCRLSGMLSSFELYYMYSTLVSHSPFYQELGPTLEYGISHNPMHDVDDISSG